MSATSEHKETLPQTYCFLKKMMAWMGCIPALSCKRYVKLCAEATDGMLSLRKRQELFLHRIICSVCRPVYKQYQTIGQLCKGLKQEEESKNCEDECLSKEEKQCLREAVFRSKKK